MAEFSSLVSIFFDPDSGAPSGLQALVEGDTIASSVLDSGTRDALTRVVDSSSTWDEGGLDTDTYNNIVITSARAEDMVTFSASVEVSTANLDTSTRNLNTFSGDVETSANTLDSDITTLQGRVTTTEGDITNLETSTDTLYAWSGTVDASVVTLDSNLTDLETSARNLSGILDASTDYPNAYVTTNEADLDETRTVRNVSGTAFLTGATPTLSNALDADGNNINGVGSLYGTPGGTTLNVSAPSLRLLHLNDPAATITIGKIGSLFTTGDFAASANNWSTVYNQYVGNRFITLPDSPVRKGQIIFTSGTAPFGYGLTHISADPLDGQPLVWNAAGNTWDTTQLRINILADDTGADPSLGEIAVGDGSNYTAGDHGDIGGLSDDDHPQYVLADASREVSGNLTVVTYDNTPGTPPDSNVVLKTVDETPISPTQLGEIRYSGNNSTPANRVYARVRGTAAGVTAGSEDGQIDILVKDNGQDKTVATFDQTEVTVASSVDVSGHDGPITHLDVMPLPGHFWWGSLSADMTAAATARNWGTGTGPDESYHGGSITWNNSTQQITVSKTGMYRVYLHAPTTVATTQTTRAKLYVGGVMVHQTDHQINAATDPFALTFEWIGKIDATDTVYVTIEETTATYNNTPHQYSTLSVTRLA